MADEDGGDVAHGVLAEAVVHQPKGLVVEDFEIADEDGVALYESVVHLLGGIAQQGGFMFDNLYKVGVSMPRNFGPPTKGASRFDEAAREFRLVRSDAELAAVLRGWLAPKFVKERTKNQRSLALAQIHLLLDQKAEAIAPNNPRNNANANNANVASGMGQNPAQNEGANGSMGTTPLTRGPGSRARRVSLSSVGSEAEQMEAAVALMSNMGGTERKPSGINAKHLLSYDEECAMHGLWELARYEKNVKHILATADGHMLETLTRILEGLARSFEGQLAKYLAATLWALSLHEEPRRAMAAEKLAAKIFIILQQRNMFNATRAPESHVFALGALRALMEHPSNHRLLLEAPADYGIDLPGFVASIMLHTYEQKVWEHASSILLRCIARDERALYQFLEEYPLLGGDPVKVVRYMMAPLQDISGVAPRPPPRKSADADTYGTPPRASNLVMGSGARLAMAVLLYKLARHSDQGRLVLLLTEQSSTNHPIHSLLRWALHAMLSASDFSDPPPAANKHKRFSLTGEPLTMSSNTRKQRSIDSLGFAEDDNTPGHYEEVKNDQESTIMTCTDPVVLFDALYSLVLSDTVDRSSSRKILTVAPDLDSEETTIFNQEEWNMPCGRGHDITLLYAATALWGICKCLSDSPSEAEGAQGSKPKPQKSAKSMSEAVNDAVENVVDMGDFNVSTMSTSWKPELYADKSFDPTELLREETMASLFGLILVTRRSGDEARPAVQVCAMSALNALANASNPLVRAKLLRLTDDVLFPNRKQQQDSDTSSEKETISEMTKRERATEIGEFSAKILVECLLGTGDLNAVHPRLRIRLQPEPLCDNACVAYGLSALCGMLETCVYKEVPASVALPSLKPESIVRKTMPGSILSPEVGERSKASSGGKSFSAGGTSAQHAKQEALVRHLACAASMMFAMDPSAWKLDDLRALLAAMLTDPRPTGSNSMFLTVSLWSLARQEDHRVNLLRENSLTVLLEVCDSCMKIIDIYRRVLKAASRNKAEIDRLVSEAQKVLRTKDLPNISISSEEDREQNFIRVKEHLNSLNATLAAIWQLLVNRPFFEAIALSDTKADVLFANLNYIKEDRRLIKQVREKLFEMILRILRAICVGTQDSSYGAFAFFATKHCHLVDTIGHKALSILWILASLRISDRLLCTESFVQVLLDVAYNENVIPANRTLVARMLCYFDRLPAMTETSSRVGVKFERLAGPTYLSALIVHMLGSQSIEVQSCAGRLLGQLRSTTVGQALVRDNGGIMLLLKLTEDAENEVAVHNALRGLRHVSLDPKSQVYLCRHGLYRLLEMAWTSPHIHHRRIIAQIVRQLSENAENKTLIYKAELRSRQMLGWRNKKVPKFSVQDAAARAAQEKKQKDRTFRHDKHGDKAAFLDWLDELKQGDGTEYTSLFDESSGKVRVKRRTQVRSEKRRQSMPRAQAPSLEDIYVGDDESSAEDDDGDSEGMKRTLSSFLLELRQEISEAEGIHPTTSRHAHLEKLKRPELEVVIPRITISSIARVEESKPMHLANPPKSNQTRVPSKPSGPVPPATSSGKSSPTSPRTRRFRTVKSPVESPLWDFRNDIPGAIGSSKNSTKRASPRHANLTLHSAHSPFDAETHHAAAIELGQHLKKPSRVLWAPPDLQSNMGRTRWEPNVSEVTIRTPQELDLELEFIRTGKLPTDGVSSIVPAKSSPKKTLKLDVDGQPNVQGEASASSHDASALQAAVSQAKYSNADLHTGAYDIVADPTLYQPRRVNEIRVKMNSSRPYSQFVFNRGGDPYSNLRAIDADLGEETGSETSLSSDDYNSDSSSGEAPSEEIQARTAEKLAKKKRRALKRQHRRDLKRRIENMTSPKRVSLSKFPHKEGARVYNDLPRFCLPDGEEIFLYLSGGPLFGKDNPEDVDTPELPPSSTSDLGFENGRLPKIPRLLSNEKCLAGTLSHAPLPIAYVTCPPTDFYSLASYDNKQPLTKVTWTRDGRVLDEQLPMLTRHCHDGHIVESSDDENSQDGNDGEPWNIDNSIFAQRVQTWGSFYNAQDIRAAAFEKDWQLCEQKRTFRKLVSRYEDVITDLKRLLVANYDMVCDSFRYFSATMEIGSIFTLQMLEFTELCEHADIKETAADSLIQEGHCNTIFIQVTKNAVEDWTPAQHSFESECTVLSLKRGSSMMRYQYLEALVRVAEAKYVKSGKSPDACAGVEALFNGMRAAGPMEPVLGAPDRFRADILYREDVDIVLREHLSKFKSVFSQYAGVSENSNRAGGCRGKRLAFVEWQEFLVDAGMFNPLFTLRECNTIFRNSTLDLIDEIQHWRELVALGFLDFLEALGRLACHMVIPNQDQLEEVGADSIVEYYKIMESTGLWMVVHEGYHADLEAKPLSTRLTQLVMILNNMQERTNRLALESKLWKASQDVDRREHVEAMRKVKKRVVGSITQMGGSNNSLQGGASRPARPNTVSTESLHKNVRSPLSPKSLQSSTRPQSPASQEESTAGAEEDVEETSLSQALRAVEEGIPMDRFEAHVAATLHDVWRENRGRQEDGTYNPRVKVIKDVEYDIANLAFSDLPGHFQMDNLLAAHDACESIRQGFVRWERANLDISELYVMLESEDFLKDAAASQHEHWLKRNAKKSWVEDAQRLPFEELNVADQQKNRDIVETAVKVWIAHHRHGSSR